MHFGEVLELINKVPDYQEFLTVDELNASSHQLAKQYPKIVQLESIGHSGQGEPINLVKIGNGSKKALLFAMPHPNEPIGGMALEYFSRRLAEDEDLRQSLDYTWYLIKCIDPDGTRLNEGWFKGPFSIKTYARHFYRSPAFQQVEWTFPIDYKTLHFHQPLPETKTLIGLMEKVSFDFLYSLHNSGFGGAYFYISEAAPDLYPVLYQLIESQALPLHLGEPEISYVTQYAQAIFKVPLIEEAYEFLAKQTEDDPALMLSGGTASFDYVTRFSNPFSLVCEIPNFFNAAIQDTTPSDILRKDTILQSLEQAQEDHQQMQALYAAVEQELTIPSPFRDSIEEILRVTSNRLTAQANWAKNDIDPTQNATMAEEFDSLKVKKFYRLRNLGMLIRMIEFQINAQGTSNNLSTALEQAQSVFEERCTALEKEMMYSVIPIQKLVRVQLGSALLVIDYLASQQPRN